MNVHEEALSRIASRSMRQRILLGFVLLVWLFGFGAVFMFGLENYCDVVLSNNTQECESTETFAAGFFWAVNSGFSIGFGMLQVKSGGWMFLSILHALFGSVVVITVLSLVINHEIALAIRFQSMGVKRKRSFIWEKFVAVVYVLYLGVGVCWGCFGPNKWSFSKSLYFSFFAISTGGVQNPGGVDDARLYFTALYCFFGVPIYAYFCGRAAIFLHLTFKWYDDLNQGAALENSSAEMREAARAASEQNVHLWNQLRKGEMNRRSLVSPHIGGKRISEPDDAGLTYEEKLFREVKRAEAKRLSYESPHVSGRFDPIHSAQAADDDNDNVGCSGVQMTVT